MLARLSILLVATLGLAACESSYGGAGSDSETYSSDY